MVGLGSLLLLGTVQVCFQLCLPSSMLLLHALQSSSCCCSSLLSTAQRALSCIKLAAARSSLSLSLLCPLYKAISRLDGNITLLRLMQGSILSCILVNKKVVACPGGQAGGKIFASLVFLWNMTKIEPIQRTPTAFARANTLLVCDYHNFSPDSTLVKKTGGKQRSAEQACCMGPYVDFQAEGAGQERLQWSSTCLPRLILSLDGRDAHLV